MANTQYITYTDLAKAQAAEQEVFDELKAAMVELGYQVDAQGIIGKRNGVDAPESARTERWSGMQQIADGRYVVPHPNWHPEIAKSPRVGNLMARLPKPSIVDQDDGTWWPEEEI